MSKQECVIVGASHAGVSLALALRKEGWEGGIKLVGAENELPYHRPPLSKEYLAGKKELDAVRLRPQKVYDDNAIELMLGTTVLGLDAAAKKITLHDGGTLGYDKMALCTGASVRKLALGKDLDRVLYIRTAADVRLIKDQLPTVKNVVIVGGGYIGLEAAAVFAGLGARVTVLEMASRVLSRVAGAPLSEYITRLHNQHGVVIKTSTEVTRLSSDDSARAEVIVECGSGETLEADVVLVGIGVEPNTDLAAMAGLKVENGIVVDQWACTSDSNIYAAGDCTRHPSLIYNRGIRLESVQNATDQARTAAANICGKQTAYAAVPWFWSDQYDVKLQMVGLNEGFDQVITRGDPGKVDEGFALFYLQASRLIAADCVKRPKEFMVSKQLVAQGQVVDASMLADPASDPASWK